MATKTVEETRNIMSVSLSEAIKITKQVISTQPAKDAISILLIGPVGMGKTEALMQIANETTAYGHKKKGMSLEIRHLSQVHPLDMAGVGLDNENKKLYYAQPPLHDELLAKPAPRLCMFDEIDRCQPIAQSAMLQFLLSHELNGFKVPETWVVAAANGWHAQYTYELDKATASRLLILHVEPKQRDWMLWAASNNVDVRVLATIENCPDLLNQQTKENEGALKLADPRAWKRLSDALQAGFPTEYAGAFVGTNAAKKFELFARIQHDYSKEIAQVVSGKKVSWTSGNQPKTAIESNRTLFCIYMAAAGQVKEIPQARSFLENGIEQMDMERTYIASRLITYNIDSKALCADPKISDLHIKMINATLGEGK